MLIKFKEKITGKTAAGGTKDVEIMVPLKYLCNFWRKFKMSLMNSEIILKKIQLGLTNVCYLVVQRQQYSQ